MYLDKLRCTEQSNPHRYEFTGPCIVTGNEVTVSVRSEELFAYRQGAYIQDALKSNTPAEREFLLSGISETGWNQIFKEDET